MPLIPAHLVEKIKAATDLLAVAEAHTSLRPSGNSHLGDCPLCGGKKKFTVTPGKGDAGIWKCFKCDEGGDAVKLVMLTDQLDFPAALRQCAERFGVSLADLDDARPTKSARPSRHETFLEVQLRASGLDRSCTHLLVRANETTEVEVERYQAATLDLRGEVVPGDDMVLHYFSLDRRVVKYHPSKGEPKPFRRVRYANPEAHRGKDGKLAKYRSPAGSGVHAWYPNGLIEAFEKRETFDTLYFVEGEKKADRMMLSGLHTVGLGGIHGFAKDGSMPSDIERIIKFCAVQRVVFVFDADWQQIKALPGQAADQRPRGFASAAMRFHTYFRGIERDGFKLELFIAAPTDITLKGMDDVIVLGLSPDLSIAQDFATALLDRNGKGRYLQTYQITQWSSHKIYDLWHLSGFEAFAKTHFDELKAVGTFKFNNLERRYNAEENSFELAQKVLPSEMFWRETEVRGQTQYAFDYEGCYHFLQNRGFGRLEIRPDVYRSVHQNHQVVTATTPIKIRTFVTEFTRELENRELVNMLHRGATQYLGPNALEGMFKREINFLQPEREAVYLVFKNCFWKVTADAITERPLQELPAYVWAEQLIDFEPKLAQKPMVSIDVDAAGEIELNTTDDFSACDFAQFVALTSWNEWTNAFNLTGKGTGQRRKFKGGQLSDYFSPEELKAYHLGIATKMAAAGYVIQPHIYQPTLRAIIGMDARESNVGESNGGTGKSLWAQQFSYLMGTEWIDGKKRNILEDQFIYANVTERTQAIVYDDVSMNFNFEHLFSQITAGITVNAKGEAPYRLPPRRMIILTNHALQGSGGSFQRRQFYITFSDFFSASHSPTDQFKKAFFHDWTHEQWNLFYNFQACQVQTYLRIGLRHSISLESVERRVIRQTLGEDMMEFCSQWWNPQPDSDGLKGLLINRQISVKYLYEAFLREFPKARAYLSRARFQAQLRMFADYAQLHFNPETSGKRIKSDRDYYLVLADESYNANAAKNDRIRNDNNSPLVSSPTPF